VRWLKGTSEKALERLKPAADTAIAMPPTEKKAA
jgi:hypothetical protein